MGEMLLNGRLYGASGIRELTQAQYDALPDSKYTDGILYCIKDTGIVEGEKFAPVIYSLEEREVGVWTDGKPLYQKSYVFTNHALSTGNNSIPLDVLQNGYIDKIVQSFAYITNSAKTSIRPINNYNNTSDALDYALFYGIGEGFIIITTYTSWSSPNIYITIQYTKTTDIPGSGTWGTDGVPMVHYDGNEKIIGTWFGKPLYEKVLTHTETKTVARNGTYTFLAGLSNIDFVVKCDSIYNPGWDAGHWRQNYSSYYEIDTDLIVLEQRDRGGNSNEILGVKTILQYTKTTD